MPEPQAVDDSAVSGTQDAGDSPTVIAIDAMGGDHGPETVLAGLARSMRAAPGLRFLVHGPEATLAGLLKRHGALADRCTLRDAARVISMNDKPAAVMRRPEGTSMHGTLSSLGAGDAAAAVSCGNTGALMLLATQVLGRAPGVDRPAIAVFWPARTKAGFTIALDMGAGLSAEPDTLAMFAAMGAEYARVGLDVRRPRVGVLNVGAEDTKGRSVLQEARDLVAGGAEAGGYEPVGFVEGGDLCGDRADVIVTDGFTGNVALKTAEGVASFIGDETRRAFAHSPLSKLMGLLAKPVFNRLKRRIDPRRVNGGVFLGLGGAVVKSHGGADATGVASAVLLAARMAQAGFAHKVAAHTARLAAAPGVGAAAQ